MSFYVYYSSCTSYIATCYVSNSITVTHMCGAERASCER